MRRIKTVFNSDKSKAYDNDKEHIEKKRSNTSRYGKIIAREVYDTASTFKNYVPLFGSVLEVMDHIIESYENVQHNEKLCLVLVDRVEMVKASVSRLVRHYKEDEKKFRSKDYFKAFNRLDETLKSIRTYITEVSNYTNFRKTLFRKNIKEECQDLLTRLEYTCNALQFGIVISEADRKKEDDYLAEGMKKTLQELGAIKDKQDYWVSMVQVNEIKKQKLEHVKTIKPEELSDGMGMFENSIESRGKIIKKYLNLTIPVACKPVNYENDSNEGNKTENKDDDKIIGEKKFRNNLTILSKLHSSDKIIRFHGISPSNGKNVLIFDWAEKGNLKDLYENEDIPWITKLKYAKDISEGLFFLRTCQIYHHDVRCENVLITCNDGAMTAKLANFELSRETTWSTTVVDNIAVLIRWMAPEKIDDKGNSSTAIFYSAECEVYSFALTLWELSFQKFPYMDIDIEKIYNHVLEGKREHLNFPDEPSGITERLKTIIEKCWKEEAMQRLKINEIYIELKLLLESLNKNNEISSHISKAGVGESPNKNNEITQINHNNHNNYYDDDDDDLDFDGNASFLRLEDGITKFKNEKRKKERNAEELQKILRCFEFYVSLDNTLALYWKANYHEHIERDMTQALKLYREAADKGNSDSQCLYAMKLKDTQDPGLNSNIINYLRKSAEQENESGLYLYGKALYEGMYGAADHKNGENYLKAAAVKGNKKAREYLEKLKVEYV